MLSFFLQKFNDSKDLSPQQVCPAMTIAKMQSLNTTAQRFSTACSFTCWHFWNPGILILFFYFPLRPQWKISQFFIFIKRKQLRAWVKAGESESKFWTNFPHISSGNLPQDWPLMSLLFSSWVSHERRYCLAKCEGVWSDGSASLKDKDATTQSLLTCTLIQILERRAEAAFKSITWRLHPGSQHSD